MPISIATTGIYANFRTDRFTYTPTIPAAPAALNDDRSELVVARKAIVTLQSALDDIQELFRPMRRSSSIAVSATSSANLGLDLTQSFSVLQSVEEVNTTPTSFTPFGPVISGSSSSEATIDGVYTGTIDDTLTFNVKKATGTGVVGTDDIDVEVRDGAGNKTDTIKLKNNTPPGTEFTLSSGLVVTFSAGQLVKKDSFEVDVFTSIPSAVDPDKPLTGIRNDNPNLEYGLDVIPGSFEINGVSINVTGTDSLNMVLDKITQSAAGVTASFDAASEMVVLTQKTAGSTNSITLANDTSGFLVATKLDTAVVVPGSDGIPETPIDQVPQLAAISSGTLSVNGTGITIDISVDSLQDVLTRINASAAGVSATLDASGERVSITSNDPNQQVVLDSGDTNFFPTLLITDGTYEPVQGSGKQKQLSRSDAQAFIEAFRDVSSSFGQLFEQANPDFILGELRTELKSAASAAFGSEGPAFRTRFGVNFDFNNAPKKIVDFTVANSRLLDTALRKDYTDIETLLFGDAADESDGMFDQIRATLVDAETSLREKLGSTGSLLDILV